ncbi:MAG: efflux RND transporter periplasmic adaptor subunit [Gammaproteobacteria bacterium]
MLLALAGAGFYLYLERPWERRVVAVAVETVTPGTVTQALAVNGRIAPRHSVNVRSAVSAQAVEVFADEGERVTEDEMLLRLNTSQPQALVAQAQAALEAGLVRQRQTQAAFDRATALGDNVTRSSREDAELALASATNEVERLRGALDLSLNELALYTITSPLTGVVIMRGVDEGQMVDTQTELFTIADLSTLVVETDVDEVYSARMRVGLSAVLRPAGDGQSRTGSVSFAAPSVDSATGGRAIRIAFDEPVSLPVGLTVSANIIVGEHPEAISVPRGAILTEAGQSQVMLLEDGVATLRDIAFSDWPAERVIVTSGIAAGDQVILDPAAVKPGQAVAPRT